MRAKFAFWPTIWQEEGKTKIIAQISLGDGMEVSFGDALWNRYRRVDDFSRGVGINLPGFLDVRAGPKKRVGLSGCSRAPVLDFKMMTRWDLLCPGLMRFFPLPLLRMVNLRPTFIGDNRIT